VEEKTKCPICHTEVKESDYFCFNCGANLKPKPPSLDIQSQLTLYLKSVLIPPLGIYWALPYLKQSNPKSKAVGCVAIVITIVMLVLATIWVKQLTDNFNKQLNNQLDILQY
jgi:hypothetical protein